jgi:phosphotransferase system HPr-like phosphotransfer protein
VSTYQREEKEENGSSIISIMAADGGGNNKFKFLCSGGKDEREKQTMVAGMTLSTVALWTPSARETVAAIRLERRRR